MLFLDSASQSISGVWDRKQPCADIGMLFKVPVRPWNMIQKVQFE